MVDQSRRRNPADSSDEADGPTGEGQRTDEEARPGSEGGYPPETSNEAAELRKERDGLQDRLLRQAAEFDNFRKRIERERRDTAEYAAVDLLKDLLPIIDDFERALQADEKAESYRKGLDIIHRGLMDMLRKRGVTQIEAVGTDFDPHLHQAVSHEDAPDRRDGEVIQEFARGYRLGERLLRPAMVKVAKAS